MNYFNRFDICEAHYLALAHCHAAGAAQHRRLHRLRGFFTPRPMLAVENLTSNGRGIFEVACSRIEARAGGHSLRVH
jgi:hypothetical protein